MGIEFTGLDPSTQDKLQQQVNSMVAESDSSRKVPGAF
jgi:hypothetical protein